MLVVVVLGLLAGFLFAASASLQQHAARRTATRTHTTDAVAAMTITNPLASYLLGVLVFRVAPPTSPGALAALAGAGLLLIVGVSALARSPSVRRPDPVADAGYGHRPDVAYPRPSSHS